MSLTSGFSPAARRRRSPSGETPKLVIRLGGGTRRGKPRNTGGMISPGGCFHCPGLFGSSAGSAPRLSHSSVRTRHASLDVAADGVGQLVNDAEGGSRKGGRHDAARLDDGVDLGQGRCGRQAEGEVDHLAACEVPRPGDAAPPAVNEGVTHSQQPVAPSCRASTACLFQVCLQLCESLVPGALFTQGP